MKHRGRFSIVIAIAVVILLAFFLKTNCRGWWKGGPDTISTKHDTVWVRVKADTQYVPMPYAVYYPKNIPVPIHDTLEIFDTFYPSVDTARILSQYFATRVYADTQSVPYGNAIIRDTVTQNRITGRSLTMNQSIPEVTTTITVNQKRTIAFVGLMAAGNEHTPVYMVGPTIGVKFKNDRYLGASYLLTRDGYPLYGINFQFPIKFRK